MIFDGHNGGSVEVLEDVLVIRRKGLASLFNHGRKGEKRIPFESISSIQFKDAGLTTGYIQFGIIGGQESRAGVAGAVKDENTVLFVKKASADFQRLRDLVEERSVAARRNARPAQNSAIEYLLLLADLRDREVLTEAEFLREKAKLLAH